MAASVRCYKSDEGDPAASLDAIRRRYPRLIAQGFSETAATNEFFFEMVGAQTVYAAATGNLLAKKPEIDLLLRVAGTTQISVAISKMGARKGQTFLVAVAGDRRSIAGLKAPAGWVRLPRTGLTERELVRIEKAALLNARKG